MEKFTIVLGNKAYSSWSLRGWLPLVQTGVAFDEVVIPLRQVDSKSKILEHSPSGLVPALEIEGESERLTICDSLAIGEFLAEQFPSAGLWPADRMQRAAARTVVAQMHAGFPDLRSRLPMDLKSRHPRRSWDAAATADIKQVFDIWRGCRNEAARDGPFLFGAFTIADAFYAPVVLRFRTYDVELDPVCRAYSDAILAWSAMKRWIAEAEQEPWVIEFDG